MHCCNVTTKYHLIHWTIQKDVSSNMCKKIKALFPFELIPLYISRSKTSLNLCKWPFQTRLHLYMEERLGGAKTRWCGCKYWSLEPLYTLHLHWVPETRKCTGLHPGLWKSSRILTLWGLSRWWLTQMFQYILIESWTEQRRHIASGRDKVYLTRPSWPNAYLGPEPTKYWKNKYMWIYLTSIAKPRQTTMDKYSDILFHRPGGCHYFFSRLPLWQLFMYFHPYCPVLPFPSSTINGQSSGCGDITINNIYSPYRYCKIETLFAEVVNSLVLTARHRRRCVKWFHDIFCSHERSVLSLSDISYCILTFPTHFRELKSELMWLLEISYCIKMGDLAFRDFTFLKVSMHNIYSNFVSQTFMSFRRQPITYFQWVCLYSISEVRGLLIDRQGHFNANADCQWFIILILMLLLRLMSLHPRCPLSSTCYSYISKIFY